MKNDFGENDGRLNSMIDTSKLLHQGKGLPRANWGKSAKAIARDGDDHLILGEFPNLDDKFIEW